MERWLLLALCLAALAAGLYLAYSRGFMAMKCIRAVVFFFRRGRDADRVTLTRCTGWVRHVGRLPGDRRYALALETQLSEGEAKVLLLDRQKRPLLQLDRQTPAGQIELGRGERCHLRWEFRGATGGCTLRWQPEEVN